MRNIVKGLVVASLVGSSGVYADNMYISVGGGLSKLKTMKSTEMPILYKNPTFARTPELGDDVDTLKFKGGAKLAGAIGYGFLDYRVEIEYSRQKNKYQGFYLNKEPILFADDLFGYVKIGSLFLNGYYDLRLSSFFTPYLGMGIGNVKVTNKLSQRNFVCNDTYETFPIKSFKDKSNSIAYQLIAGMKLYVNDNVSLNTDYRFSKTFKKISAFDKTLANHSINLSLSYYFN